MAVREGVYDILVYLLSLPDIRDASEHGSVCVAVRCCGAGLLIRDAAGGKDGGRDQQEAEEKVYRFSLMVRLQKRIL